MNNKKNPRQHSMLRNIAATARTALNANLAGVRRARTMSTIPVNNVARIVRMKVAGEEDAIKAAEVIIQQCGMIKFTQITGLMHTPET